MDVDMYLMSTDLKKHNISGNIASNRETGSHAAWHKTFRLAYWLDARYYGQRGENTSDTDLKNELKKHNIDYYFFWGDTDILPDFLKRKQDVTRNETPGLKVFLLE